MAVICRALTLFLLFSLLLFALCGASRKNNALFHNFPSNGYHTSSSLQIQDVKRLVKDSLKLHLEKALLASGGKKEEEDDEQHEKHPADELLKKHKADGTMSYILGGY